MFYIKCRKGFTVADLSPLQKTLHVSFHDLALLEQALVHRSYINENPGFSFVSNERLEFLGDAILGFLVAEQLYRDFPELAEGEMTRLRSVLVQRDTLARVAVSISLGDYLYLGRGEEASGGRCKPANLASALEAVVAAVYLDRGIAATRRLVWKLLSEEIAGVAGRVGEADYKSRLQELTQARYRSTPAYRMLEAVGPDHAKRFTVEVTVGEMVLGRGSGRSKKIAETEAARSALERLSAGFTL